jgi:hypothetical protein
MSPVLRLLATRVEGQDPQAIEVDTLTPQHNKAEAINRSRHFGIHAGPKAAPSHESTAKSPKQPKPTLNNTSTQQTEATNRSRRSGNHAGPRAVHRLAEDKYKQRQLDEHTRYLRGRWGAPQRCLKEESNNRECRHRWQPRMITLELFQIVLMQDVIGRLNKLSERLATRPLWETKILTYPLHNFLNRSPFQFTMHGGFFSKETRKYIWLLASFRAMYGANIFNNVFEKNHLQ